VTTTKKELRKKVKSLNRKLRNYKGGVSFGDITLYIGPDGKDVELHFTKPVILSGTKSTGLSDACDTFYFITPDHPSLPSSKGS
jgi:hypothetical protein